MPPQRTNGGGACQLWISSLISDLLLQLYQVHIYNMEGGREGGRREGRKPKWNFSFNPSVQLTEWLTHCRFTIHPDYTNDGRNAKLKPNLQRCQFNCLTIMDCCVRETRLLMGNHQNASKQHKIFKVWITYWDCLLYSIDCRQAGWLV